jgi:hypothetical protein
VAYDKMNRLFEENDWTLDGRILFFVFGVSLTLTLAIVIWRALRM